MNITAICLGATLLGLTFALTACQQDLRMSNNGAVPSLDLRACATAGGTIQSRGKLGRPMCVLPYSDAGKSCSGKKDCQGRCLANEGPGGLPKLGEATAAHCQPDNRLYGCYVEVESGKARPAVCVD